MSTDTSRSNEKLHSSEEINKKFMKALDVIDNAFIYRDLLCIPQPVLKDGAYLNRYQQWFAMSEKERDSRRQIAEQSVEFYKKAKQDYEAAIAAKQADDSLHTRRPVFKRSRKRHR